MTNPLRLLGLMAALSVTAGAGAASAQTVIVRKAPAGSAVEVVLNTTAIGSAKADALGDAVVPRDLSAQLKQPEIDATVSVDVCEGLHRVVVVERSSAAAPPAAGCERREIAGLFLVRRISTLVVDVSGRIPTMLLVQGSYSLSPEGPGKVWRPAASGISLFGGAGLGKFGNAVAEACGGLTPCGGDTAWGALTGGVTYWIAPFLAAEVGYVKPAQLKVEGSSDRYRFTSDLDAHIVTIAGKVGAPIGIFRIYGHAGANYQRGTMGTTQTIDDLTITVNGAPQTVPGGSQTFELKTAGWGWLAGGGLEVWLSRSLGLYAEAGRMTLKGPEADGGEGEMDDNLTTVFIGARFRLGGR
jgi:hypothetical protein